MKTIALVAQKGGTGKSTIAMHLAVCAGRDGKSVALVDLDPQTTVMDWGEMRTERRKEAVRQGEDLADDPLDGAIVSARVQEVPGLLQAAEEQGADWTILDTAGRMDITAANVMGLADLVLVPCRASFPDLKASLATVEQMERSKPKKAFFVLNAIPAQGLRGQEAREALQDYLPVSPVELHHYVAYGDALNDGRSVEELNARSKAAQEIQALYRWINTL